MMLCGTCGGAVFPSGEAIGYGGPICAWGGNHPYYGPIGNLTEADVRRIVREELQSAEQQSAGQK